MTQDDEAHSADSAGRRLWYVRRSGRVQGPFPLELIQRYTLLGRVREDDEISSDRREWVAVGAMPEARHPDLRGHVAPERLVAVRRREDERSGRDRREGRPVPAGVERRAGERRAAEPVQTIEHRERRRRINAAGDARRRSSWPLLAVGALLVAVVIMAVMFPSEPAQDASDCTARARPQVNWSNCPLQGAELAGARLDGATLQNALLNGAVLLRADLAGADLSYANLSTADLTAADLRDARLFGTSLRNATLARASLRGADLSYAILAGADLRGADLRDVRLDHAVWIDGSECLPGSTGECLVAVTTN